MQKIVEGCINRDRSSQYLLYKQYYSFCMAICRRYAVNDIEAADVLNDAFLKVFTNIDKYDASRPFKTWLAKIITNTAIDYYRANLKFSLHDDISAHEDIGQHASIYSDMAYKELLTCALTLRITSIYKWI